MTRSPLTLSRLAALAFGLLLAAAAVLFLLTGTGLYHGANTRVRYAVLHLPLALADCAAACLLAAALPSVARRLPSGARNLSSPLSAGAALAALLGAFWLPILLTGGFWQDDWLLLAASHVRQSILHNPVLAWQSLDVVNGNFRPLGIGLYFGVMEHAVGTSPRIFLAVNFLLIGLTVVVLFRLVRTLRFPAHTATVACALFLSRGLLYTLFGWACAISDVLVNLLVPVVVLLAVRAERRNGASAVLWHGLAWIVFCLALLSKQSAFTVPPVIALLVLLRPALPPLALPSRLRRAALLFALYTLPTIVVYLQGRALLNGQPPYPVQLSVLTAARLFSFAFWYFAGSEIIKGSVLLPSVLGGLIVLAAAVLVRQAPAWREHRPVLTFLFAAAALSVSLLAFLPTVISPYYGALAALWLSMALSIVLTAPPPRSENLRAFVGPAIAALVLAGFVEVRLKQTALLPSGGFMWGTLTAEREANWRQETLESLAAHPEAHTVVLVDYPYLPAFYAAMILRDDPAADHIYAYTSATREMVTNSLDHVPPPDDPAALHEVAPFRWDVAVRGDRERDALQAPDTLALAMRADHIEVVPAARLAAEIP